MMSLISETQGGHGPPFSFRRRLFLALQRNQPPAQGRGIAVPALQRENIGMNQKKARRIFGFGLFRGLLVKRDEGAFIPRLMRRQKPRIKTLHADLARAASTCAATQS